jgi:hypothetical protein
MALGLYIASVPPAVSFIIVLVTIIISSAEVANSLMIRCTICRKLASLCWNSFEIPKKRVVASLVGNFSPVYRSRAIFVRRTRHFRGWIGEELNNRAGELVSYRESRGGIFHRPSWNTEVLSTLTRPDSASSSFLLYAIIAKVSSSAAYVNVGKSVGLCGCCL